MWCKMWCKTGMVCSLSADFETLIGNKCKYSFNNKHWFAPWESGYVLLCMLQCMAGAEGF